MIVFLYQVSNPCLARCVESEATWLIDQEGGSGHDIVGNL